MNTTLLIPDEAVRYILFQRTAYLQFPIAPVYRLLHNLLPFQTPLYNIVVATEARLRKTRTKALYVEDMCKEFQSIQHVLPQTCSAILDIGCGVAGIDVLLHRHYGNPSPHFYLLDKSHVEKAVWYLFKSDGAFYNSLDVVKQVLRTNGIAEDHIHVREATNDYRMPLDTPMDLVLSLLSWGFHYPVAPYIRAVHRLLRNNGVVILDVRKDTDGLDVLRQHFQQIEVIVDAPKYERIVARK
ncbi:MAG: hypothetical protein CYG59_14275 [Chloroflexi bacterium]|nr:MAG: hypothetical protein CYG59_14275 [Chloroflexota bacterium]